MRLQILIIEGANFKIGALGILRIQHSHVILMVRTSKVHYEHNNVFFMGLGHGGFTMGLKFNLVFKSHKYVGDYKYLQHPK
jgi:hypothetical protein